MPDREEFEIFAIRYAHIAERAARENFIAADPHDGPMPMDFYVWAAVGPTHTYVIDTGFSATAARKRGRELLRSPDDGLRQIGVDASAVKNVILTHLHYDHVGNFDLFPQATFFVQDKEMCYATGRYMREPPFSQAYEVDEVVGLVREVYQGRVELTDGEAELSPGLSVHFIGGHTMGLQCVRVWTRRGWVVLASDASHFYANMERPSPFPIVFNVGEMLDGFRTMRRLAETPDHIVPGHDPLVLARYPAPAAELDGIAARLDVAPSADAEVREVAS